MHAVAKENDRLRLQVHVDKDENGERYFLVFYDAVLYKGLEFPNKIINGINPIDLAEQMGVIEWKKAFEIDENKPWNIEDKASWETEQKIETVIENLSALDKTEEGNAIAVILKRKYWANVANQDLINNISLIKTKSEVSQRFYFLEGHREFL